MPTDADIVARDARVFIHQHGSSPCIAALKCVGGIWLEDSAGRRLIDLHGNTTHHIGHANPRLIAAIKQQLDDLAFSPRRFANEPATRLAETLTARFRGGHSKLLLATGGSDAIEIALRLVRVATGRSAIVALDGSYHGHGMGSFALSGRHLDPRLGRQLPDIHHVHPYWRVAEGGAERMLAEIALALRTAPGGVACVIAEPMRSNCVVPPSDLWPRVASLCQAHGAKLVFDEIPSGLGKTGRFFAFEHFGVTPDVVVLGKALGGGILPIAAVLADATLDVAPELALGHYTHEKNPVTACAALTTLSIIDDERLVEQAETLGAYARASLARAIEARRATGIRGVRGLGLLLAVELEAFVPASLGGRSFADRLVDAAFTHGVSTTTKGVDAIGFSPPLVITRAEIDMAVDRLMQAAATVVDQP